jgi:hypothetical protein
VQDAIDELADDEKYGFRIIVAPGDLDDYPEESRHYVPSGQVLDLDHLMIHGQERVKVPFPCRYHGEGLPPEGVCPTKFGQEADGDDTDWRRVSLTRQERPMEQIERPGHLCRELLAFYGDEEGCTASGYTLEQILDWPDVDWEEAHDVVHWVFATDQESMFNPDAPVLDAPTIARFRADPLLRHRLRRSFDRWLAFRGVVRTDDGLALDSPNPRVWGQADHNWLRISRVLRSLNLLGLPDEAQAFFALLTTIRSRIDPTTWRYWERAARPDS